MGPSPPPQQMGCEGEGGRIQGTPRWRGAESPRGLIRDGPPSLPPTLISESTPRPWGAGCLPHPGFLGGPEHPLQSRAGDKVRAHLGPQAQGRPGIFREAVALPGLTPAPNPLPAAGQDGDPPLTPSNPSLASPAPKSPPGPRGLRDPARLPAPPRSPGLGLGSLHPSGLQSSGLSCP